jgi:hypothetical protein
MRISVFFSFLSCTFFSERLAYLPVFIMEKRKQTRARPLNERITDNHGRMPEQSSWQHVPIRRFLKA